MVEADGGGGDEADQGAGEQFAIATGAGAGDERVGIAEILLPDCAAGEIAHLGVWFEHPLEKRNLIVGNNLHGSLLCIVVLRSI